MPVLHITSLVGGGASWTVTRIAVFFFFFFRFFLNLEELFLKFLSSTEYLFAQFLI